MYTCRETQTERERRKHTHTHTHTHREARTWRERRIHMHLYTCKRLIHNTHQRAATNSNAQQYTPIIQCTVRCCALQHTATHSTHCNKLQQIARYCIIYCNALCAAHRTTQCTVFCCALLCVATSIWSPCSHTPASSHQPVCACGDEGFWLADENEIERV